MPKSTASSSSYSSDGILPATSSSHPYGTQEPNEQDSNPFAPDDYTENATAGEIREAIEISGKGRGRSDSMSGWGGEEDGQFNHLSSSREEGEEQGRSARLLLSLPFLFLDPLRLERPAALVPSRIWGHMDHHVPSMC